MITNKKLNLKGYFNRRGGRLTQQRLIILQELSGLSSHPTAETVYRLVRKKFPKISLGTVYRNLNYLTNEGLIKQLKTNDDKFHFDAKFTDHLHFICQRCKKIYDLSKSQFLKSLKNYSGGQVKKIECYLFGICKKCKK